MGLTSGVSRDARRRSGKDAPPGIAARRVAAEMLEAVLERGVTFDAAIAGNSGRAFRALDPRDRALAYNIVATSLRRLPQIDGVLTAFLRKPIDRRSSQIRSILITAAAQILFLGSPSHAVVNIAAALAGNARSGRGLKGLVNAVLRRIDAEGPAIVAGQDAAALALPGWLRSRWDATYGTAATRAIAGLQLAAPPLDVTVRADPVDWARRLGGCLLPSGSIRLTEPGPVDALEGYGEGAWWVQDAAAAVPARLFGDIDGATAIDLCAAPGGKTAQLVAAGAKVTAVDRDETRMKRLAENLDRLGLDARLEIADVTTWRPQRPADAVLLDAPCSATGTIRRHPDILHRDRLSRLDALVALQARMLAAAVEMTRPGGTIVYCTCSLEPEEGEQQIASLLESGAPVERSPIEPRSVPGFEASLNGHGELRILPTALLDYGGNDGFFVARLNRR